MPGVLNAITIVGLLRRHLHQCAERGRDLRRCSIDFAKRANRSGAIGCRYPGLRCSENMPRSSEAFLIVVQPPPVQGIGNAGGFRMMVEDRAGRGPQALAAARLAQ